MSLHPILALDHVIDEYRDYLRTEFRVKDEPASCVNSGGEIAKAQEMNRYVRKQARPD